MATAELISWLRKYKTCEEENADQLKYWLNLYIGFYRRLTWSCVICQYNIWPEIGCSIIVSYLKLGSMLSCTKVAVSRTNLRSSAIQPGAGTLVWHWCIANYNHNFHHLCEIWLVFSATGDPHANFEILPGIFFKIKLKLWMYNRLGDSIGNMIVEPFEQHSITLSNYSRLLQEFTS